MSAEDAAKARARSELRTGMYNLKTIRESAVRGLEAAELRMWAVEEVVREFEAAQRQGKSHG